MSKPAPVGHAIIFPSGDNQMSVRPGNIAEPFAAAAQPGVVAYVITVPWRQLQTADGNYTLDFVREALDLAAVYDKGLIVVVGHRDFRGELVAPDWADANLPWRGTEGGGYQIPTWNSGVMARLADVHHTIMDTDHPALIGTGTQETSTGGYGTEVSAVIADNWRNLGRAVARAHSNRRLFFRTNFLPGNQDLLEPLCLDLAAHGVAIGNPDLLRSAEIVGTDDVSERDRETARALEARFYPIFDELHDAYTFSQVNPPSYRSHSVEDLYWIARDFELNLLWWRFQWWLEPGIQTAWRLISESTLPGLPGVVPRELLEYLDGEIQQAADRKLAARHLADTAENRETQLRELRERIG